MRNSWIIALRELKERFLNPAFLWMLFIGPLLLLGCLYFLFKAGDEGKLFGSVGNRDIADAVTAAGVELAKAEVRLPLGALRTTGNFEVEVQVHTEVKAIVKISVVAEA